MTDFTKNRPSGHGWVYPRPDGTKANCGGPAMCAACQADVGFNQKAEAFADQTLGQQYADPNTVLAKLLEAMKAQLLIVLVNRLGGDVLIPLEEVDGTGDYVMEMEVDKAAVAFNFKVVRKN